MTTRRCGTLLALLILLAPCVADAVHRYTVHLGEDPTRPQVHACFDTPGPDALVAHDRRAVGYAGPMRAAGGERSVALRPRNGRVELTRLGDPGCLDYAVDLEGAVAGGPHAAVQRTAGALVLSPHLWLWYPYAGGRRQPLELVFETPPGTEVSGPWPLEARAGNRTVYRLGARPYEWDARMAMGRLQVHALEVAGASLRLAILAGEPPVDRRAIIDWITEGARALATVYGRFPVRRAHVMVVPLGRGGEPVPWGEVRRGGGEAVNLFIDQRQPPEAFRADWTLAHELAHLLHPNVDHDAPWLYEGLASYYQNVIRARAGMLVPERAWAKLHAGFQRGRQQTPSDASLAQIAENMQRNRNYMRVYWSGAAMFLLADARLRERSHGRRSLDAVLGRLARCCLPSQRRWDAHELLETLDRLSSTDTFTAIGDRYVRSHTFPALDRVYRRLGIMPVGDGVRLNDGAPDAELRRAIMRRR